MSNLTSHGRLPDGNGAVGCAPSKRRGVTTEGLGVVIFVKLWWENSMVVLPV